MARGTSDDIKLKFEELVLLIGKVLAHDKEVSTIQKNLKRHFNSALSSYIYSNKFQSLLEHVYKALNKHDNTRKYFSLLASLDEQLKRNKVKLLSSKQSLNLTNTNPIIVSNTITTSTTTLVQHSNESRNKVNPVNDDSLDEKRQKKIAKLEGRLYKLSKLIKQLEQTDMSLDEMEYCDLYVVESNLKKQAIEMYNKLTRLKKESMSIERVLDQPVTLNDIDIGYPIINECVEEIINLKKSLPSFDDVLSTIEKTDEQYQLNLSSEKRQIIAKRLFKIIGKKVKDRRIADFNDIMNSRLPENFEIEQHDPAINNSEMEMILSKNKEEAVRKTEEILQEFSQIDPKLEPEIVIESSEEFDIENDADTDEYDNLESKSNIESSDDKVEEIQYDVVDILPPFSSNSSSPINSHCIETINEVNPAEAKVEISLINRKLTILSTASIPIRSATHDSFISNESRTQSEIEHAFDDDKRSQSEPISITQEHAVQTIIPRRRPFTSCDATSHTVKRRSLTNDTEHVKKRIVTEQPETIVLE